MAERCGGKLAQGAISRIEHDHVGTPHRKTFEILAGALDVPIGTLLARSSWAREPGSPDEVAN
jgi:transcriptional regulator with XRE-family HTH domain